MSSRYLAPRRHGDHLFLGGGLELGASGGSAGRTAGIVCFLALEQRIALELALDIVGEFEIRQLQQLDRLLQLRRHDQGLALLQLQPLR